jgi:hypothetical protein
MIVIAQVLCRHQTKTKDHRRLPSSSAPLTDRLRMTLPVPKNNNAGRFLQRRRCLIFSLFVF